MSAFTRSIKEARHQRHDDEGAMRGTVFTPPGNFVLSTVPLELRHLLEVVAIAALPTLDLSALKEVFRFDFL